MFFSVQYNDRVGVQGFDELDRTGISAPVSVMESFRPGIAKAVQSNWKFNQLGEKIVFQPARMTPQNPDIFMYSWYHLKDLDAQRVRRRKYGSSKHVDMALGTRRATGGEESINISCRKASRQGPLEHVFSLRKRETLLLLCIDDMSRPTLEINESIEDVITQSKNRFKEVEPGEAPSLSRLITMGPEETGTLKLSW